VDALSISFPPIGPPDGEGGAGGVERSTIFFWLFAPFFRGVRISRCGFFAQLSLLARAVPPPPPPPPPTLRPSRFAPHPLSLSLSVSLSLSLSLSLSPSLAASIEMSLFTVSFHTSSLPSAS